MKLYINNYNIDNLSEVIKLLKEWQVKTETYIEIYSNEGIYEIDDTYIKQKNITDREITIFKEYFDIFTLILDESYYTFEKINKLPCNHFSKKINKRFFSLNRETKIQLVIESLILDDLTQPYDIYFELDENINIMDNLIKKEIIEFLSLLN